MGLFRSLFGDSKANPEGTSSSGGSLTGNPLPSGTCVGDSSSLPEAGRLHVKIGTRYVTVLRLEGQLHAIDSVCFHAGGPLGIGDIEDLEGKSCIVCPWHFYKIDINTGDKYYQAMSMVNGKLTPGDWKSNGTKQRVHKVAEANGKLYVEVVSDGYVDSDEYACNAPCGERVRSSPPSAGKVRLHSVGADGKKPSGAVLQQAREAAHQATKTPLPPPQELHPQ